ncbi:MAG: hypothetical protein MJ192_07135 [Clostridia bacterium]|nr:hypothetical protein [Clostridia bacterium]
MYDIHCHVLSGVDDGAAFPSESLDMIRMAADSGTEGIVLTPHCNIPGAYANYRTDDLLERFRSLRAAVREAGIPVRVYTGQEVFCTEDVPALLEAGKLLTLNRSRYILTEFDFYEHPDFVERMTGRLLSLGLVPIIAHPERYEFFREDTVYGRRLKGMGCLLQVNKGSLEGASGPEVQRCAVHLLEAERADFIASDAHSPYVRTTPLDGVYEYVSTCFSESYARRLLSDNPCRVLSDKTL